ncbi:hypothetical protein O181_076142 [Austropuccinia psidii MF-1]|uniref:Uncharacterized protein n=1 Tax=Austropuccinia psidii MF-1 TaxID=1389203 RepID=A0A9Q3IDI6_9BASI|nr:hypothetical protein [Austropuccinia psidii MF-1]
MGWVVYGNSFQNHSMANLPYYLSYGQLCHIGALCALGHTHFLFPILAPTSIYSLPGHILSQWPFGDFMAFLGTRTPRTLSAFQGPRAPLSTSRTSGQPPEIRGFGD